MATPGPSTAGRKKLVIYDRRSGHENKKEIEVYHDTTYTMFRDKIKREFKLSNDVPFAFATLDDNIHVRDDESYGSLDDRTELLLLDEINQALSTPVKTTIRYQPHYDTILKSGLYEYYASEGKNPLPYAIAELIDNSLSATRSNSGKRLIDVRLYFHGQPKKWMVCVVDNGKGMTMRELNDWAVMRLSKFHDRRRTRQNPCGDDSEKALFLNSDISFFGVGGKQAIFCLGEKVKMVSKHSGSTKVCELSVSKDEFQRREKEGKEIYETEISHREAGNPVVESSEDVRRLAREEIDQQSFTQVIITDLRVDTISQLNMIKKGSTNLAKELANVYYYYIHGYNGGHGSHTGSDVDITVSEYRDGQVKNSVNLRDIDDDMESKFVKSARGDSFEFQIKVPMKLGDVDLEEQPVGKKEGEVKGILRYHPHDFGGETFPKSDSESENEMAEDENDNTENDSPSQAARRNENVFKCYWNGRLIPYTTLKHLPWCAPPQRSNAIPCAKCYDRVSGVLFMNDVFKVSTNKLTFMDLHDKLMPIDKLNDCNTLGKLENGKLKRRNEGEMKTNYRKWVNDCHKELDKEIKFRERIETVPLKNKRKETRYGEIEWGVKPFKRGDLVRTKGNRPVYGKITDFILSGEHEGDTFNSEGYFEIAMEPALAYPHETKRFHLTQLDHTAPQDQIENDLRDEEKKLPKIIVHQWTHETGLVSGADRTLPFVTGQKIGEIQVNIKSREGKVISMLLGNKQLKLGIQQEITFHGDGGKCILEPVYNFTTKQDSNYHFEAVSGATANLGKHTMTFRAVMKTENGSPCVFPDIPAIEIPFVVTVGQPDHFKIEEFPKSCKVGVPFSLRMTIHDKFEYRVDPPPDLEAKIGHPDEDEEGKRILEINFGQTTIDGQTLVLNEVVLDGTIGNKKRKLVKLEVLLPQLIKSRQPLKLDLLPGPPHAIALPDLTNGQFSVENGATFEWKVEIKDRGGNLLPSNPELNITCEFPDASEIPSCNGTYLAAKPCLKVSIPSIANMKDRNLVRARVSLPDHEGVSPVEVEVNVRPRAGPTKIKVYRLDVEANERQEIFNGTEFACTAGEKLENLDFEIIDEVGVTIELLSGKDDITKQMQCDWVSKRKWPLNAIRNGRLPDIQLPKKIDGGKESYTVNLGKDLECSFTIKLKPGDAHTIESSSNNLKERVSIPFDLELQIKDRHGNTVLECPKNDIEEILSNRGEEAIPFDNFSEDKGKLVLHEVMLDESFPLGQHELVVKWADLKTTIPLTLLAGPPRTLDLIKRNPYEILRVYTNKPIADPLVFELRDSLRNTVCDSKYTITLKGKRGIKISSDSSDLSCHLDNHGQVIFNNVVVTGKLGEYVLLAEAKPGRALQCEIPINIVQDPTKPQEVCVNYDKREVYVAGAALPRFAVYVQAEDMSTMTSLKWDDVTLVTSRSKANMTSTSSSGAHDISTVVQPDQRSDTDEKGHFYFGKLCAPELAALYIYTFRLKIADGVYSEIEIPVEPAEPVRLETSERKELMHISNDNEGGKENRTIIEDLTLHVQDTYGNMCGLDLCGTVHIFVDGEAPSNGKPCLDTSSGSMDVPFKQGEARAKDIAVADSCDGEDGKVYDLVFQLEGENIDVKPLKIPFQFHDDASERLKMVELQRKKSEVEPRVNEFKKNQSLHEGRVRDLKESVSTNEREIAERLYSAGQEFTQINNVKQDRDVITDLKDRRDKIFNLPRRKCAITQFQSHNDVIGKVGLLAEIEDEEEARLISWYLSSRLDCVVTRTAQKAEEIFKQFKYRQQVWSLDCITNDGSSPRTGSPLNVPGNPTFAINKLIFTEFPEECKTVFRKLLGDTLIIDTITDAMGYRRKSVDDGKLCPTILTRKDRMRIDGDGVYGGDSNWCPEEQRERVFGQPLPNEFHEYCRQIGILEEVEHILSTRDKARQDLIDKENHWESDDMKKDREQYEQDKKELATIDEALKSHAGDNDNTASLKKRPLGSPQEPPGKTRRL